jgi:hypothetical protein
MNELLQLGNLIGASKAYAQVSHAGGLVALQRVDDQARWAQPHKPTGMNAAAVILLQKRARQGFRLGDIGVEAHGRIHAHREAGQGPPVLRQGFIAAHAQNTAVVIGKIGGDDAITEAGEAVELGRNDLAPVAGCDQDGWASLVPGQRADGVLGQLHVVSSICDRLTAPELTPDDTPFMLPCVPGVHGKQRYP